MNTEIKNMWRKKSWSIPDLLGSKSEYTKIVIGLIQQIASGNANGMDDFPKLEGVFEPRTWREYVPFLKGIGIVGNHNGSLCLSETGEWLHRNLSFYNIASVMQERFRIFGEILYVLDSEPSTVQEVDEKICDLYKLKWKNCSNTRKRMDWLEVLGLIDIIGNRKWVVTESGKRALKEWILVTPEMLDSFEDAEVSYKISEAPTEISNMIQELYDNNLLQKERCTYNLWSPSPNKIENLRKILEYSCEKVTRIELFKYIGDEFNLKVRHLALEMKENSVSCLVDMKKIDWNSVKPVNNPTITRMLTVSTGVFTALDVGEAIATKKYWVSINYVGVGRFAVAIGSDVSWGLKVRNVKKVRDVYENIKQQTFRKADADIYKRIGTDMDIQMDKFGLSLEQTEILYNLEYYKTLDDIEHTNIPITGESVKELKTAWIQEWTKFISDGFESFTQVPGAKMHWYTMGELQQYIAGQNPNEPWYRLILLEAMLFEPYYPLGTEKDKKGNDVPCKKYKYLNNPINGFKKNEGDRFLNAQFTGKYCEQEYVKRLRKSYNNRMNELNEVLKTVITSLSITAVIAIVTVATAGAFAGSIAVILVGSNFAGLSGAALTSACLAYLGGGAIAAGGAGMLGGTIAIVGGGAALGIGVGAGVGGAVGSAGLLGKKNTIMQSAKLLTSVREIFLNDEHDVEFSNSVYEQYLQNITEIEKGLVELRLKKDVAKGKEKKAIAESIKKAEESVEAMKVARKNMLKYNSSFAEGLQIQ